MNVNQRLTFGTRGSVLAQRQTNFVAKNLQKTFPDLNIQTTIYTTKGDRELSKPLPEIGGKGLFTAELEAALLNNSIDLAVHSLKDLPTESPPGLTIGAILPRENPADALISRAGHSLETLPHQASVGTSSLRRAAQLLTFRPDLKIVSLRGNVDTRIKKALNPNGPYDAIILATAGLNRMNLQNRISQQIPYEVMLPAPGQGAVAVQCRADDEASLAKLAKLHHLPTYQAVLAERTFLSELGGGCSLPIGALGRITGQTLTLQGIVASLNGQKTIRLTDRGDATNAAIIGQNLARQILARGAEAILESVNV